MCPEPAGPRALDGGGSIEGRAEAVDLRFSRGHEQARLEDLADAQDSLRGAHRIAGEPRECALDVLRDLVSQALVQDACQLV